MSQSPFLEIFLTLAALLTAVISGVVGMAGGITLLSFMTFFLSLETIIPIHGLVQLTSNFSRTWFLRHHVHKRMTLFFFAGAPLGTFLTYLLIKEIPDKRLFLIPVAVLIFYTLFRPKRMPSLKIPFQAFFVLGIFIGIMAPLVGATGPLLAPFFLRDDLNKEQIVATKAATQMFTHLLKVPLFYALAFSYQDFILPIALMCVAAIIGTRLGVYLLGRISENIFIRIYQVALFLSGIRLLAKIFLV